MKTSKTPIRTPGVKKSDQDEDNVEVYCRIRPVSGDCETCVNVISSTVLRLALPDSLKQSNGAPKTVNATFTHVFDSNSTQHEVFERVARPLVRDLIEGKNGLLFTYGITGSGKTFTMTGLPEEPGLVTRSLDAIFNNLGDSQSCRHVFIPDGSNGFDVQFEEVAEAQRLRSGLPAVGPKCGSPKQPFCPFVDEDNCYAVFVSYVEIYNNVVYDLLDGKTDSSIKTQRNLEAKTLRTDHLDMVYVSGLTEVEVKNTDEAMQVLQKGQRLRKVAHTTLNTESSRSHSVFNIRVVQAPYDSTGAVVVKDKSKVHVAQLSLVDLAGSERSDRTNNVGERMQESGNINKSLMNLRQCIYVLRKNQGAKESDKNMVPYRSYKLTYLFKNYFDSHGRVRMIVCVNPSVADYEENTQVMEFAEKTTEVQVARPLAVHFEQDGLTPGRRRAAQIYQQVVSAVDINAKLPAPPSFSVFFKEMPRVQLSGPDDADTIFALREHFLSKQKRRSDLMSDCMKKQIDFENELKRSFAGIEGLKEKYTSKCRNFEQLEEENRKFQSELKGLQHQLGTQSLRLSRYEQENRFRDNQEEMFKRKEKQMTDKVRERDERLRIVKHIVDPLTPSSGLKRGSQDSLNGNTVSTANTPMTAIAGSSRGGGAAMGFTPSSVAGPTRIGLYPSLVSKAFDKPANLTPSVFQPRGRYNVSTPLRNAAQVLSTPLRSGAAGKRRAPSPPPKPVITTLFSEQRLNRRRSKSVGDGFSDKIVPRRNDINDTENIDRITENREMDSNNVLTTRKRPSDEDEQCCSTKRAHF